MAAKEPTAERRHRDAARDVYKELPGAWAEDVRLIAQALANAESAAAEKAWHEGYRACQFDAFGAEREPANPYRLPAKGDSNEG